MYFVILYSPTEEARPVLDGDSLKIFPSSHPAEECGINWAQEGLKSYEVFKLGNGEMMRRIAKAR